MTAKQIRNISYAHKIKRHIHKYGWLHLMILPGILYYLLFKYLPMYGIVIAFSDYRATDGFWGIIHSEFVGFKNFSLFFESIYFRRLVGNTIWISFVKMLFGFPAPIILALLMNEIKNAYFKRTIQTITYLPHFLSWIVLAALLKTMFSTDNGPIYSVILKLTGIEIPSVIMQNSTFVPFLVLSDIYKGVGWGTIIYLAAISGVDEGLYDAALIDGANRFQRIMHITVPSIMEIISIQLILRVGGLMNENFDQIFNLYSPGVYDVADVLETFVYRAGIQDSKYSFASAVGLFQSLTGLILVFATNKIANKLGSNGLW
ncbi:MAG: sugar ABC transporter permease [Clostridia bacterium]|nr:sugar ABC transporter permease [Clostridia bacterium]